MKTKNKFAVNIILIAAISISVASCKKEKEAKLPTVTLKTGAGYYSSSGPVSKNAILKIGMVAEKNESDLRKLDITVVLPHETSETNKKTFYIDAGDADRFEAEYELNTGNESGNQTWRFKATDKLGNVGEESIILNVQ